MFESFLDLRIANEVVWTWVYKNTNSVAAQHSGKKANVKSDNQALPLACHATLDKAPYNSLGLSPHL